MNKVIEGNTEVKRGGPDRKSIGIIDDLLEEKRYGDLKRIIIIIPATRWHQIFYEFFTLLCIYDTSYTMATLSFTLRVDRVSG